MSRILPSVVVVFAFLASAAHGDDFAVSVSETGVVVDFLGKPLISGSSFQVGKENRLHGVRAREQTLPDGTKVWNCWNESPEMPLRQEVGLKPGGSEVELGFQVEFDAWHPALQVPGKRYELSVPLKAWEGMQYSGYAYGQGRNPERVSGTIDRKTWPNGKSLDGKSFSWLMLSDKEGRCLVLDFDPVGVANAWGGYGYSVFRNRWQVVREGERIRLRMGFHPPFHGGSLSGKVKMFRGTMDDFSRRHALTRFSYIQPFEPKFLFSFGAPTAGKEYRPAATTAYSPDARYGWMDTQGLTTNVGHKEGAFYSNVSGRGPCRYKVSGLPPGVYMVTLGCGNAPGTPNRFSARCNGVDMLKDCRVEPGTATVATVPMWIEQGDAVFEFDGDFIVSTLGLQFLLAETEDFSFRRGFWLADGYEPAVLYKNEHYRPEPKFASAVESFPLPPPGKEAQGKPKKLDAPVEQPDQNDPRLDWRYSAIFSSLGPPNNGTMAEFNTPEKLARRLDELKEKNVNAIIVNDMLSRHTYPAHRERAREKLKEIADAAHRRGMKVIDHQDVTLLWNIDSGFRVMTEQTPVLNRMIGNHLPSMHFCLINPRFQEPFLDYITDLVRYSGTDALMLDEATFFAHGCGCAYCRETFHRETGYYLPVNELSGDLNNPDSLLWKTWKEWQRNRIGSWKGEVRRRIKPFRPDLSILGYTTHGAFTTKRTAMSYGAFLYDGARSLDFIGSEIMTQNLIQNARTLAPFRKSKNLFRLAYGCPIYGLVYAHWDWDNAYFGWALNNMHGQVTWEIVRDCPPGKTDYHAFAPENMDLKRAEPVADILFYFSIQSCYWNRFLDFRPELFGAAQTLETMHLPYQFIGDENLTPEFLARYKVLFLGASECLSDKQLATIKDYVRSGGTVSLTTQTGRLDEIGELRDRWGFADVFGFEPADPDKKEELKVLLPADTGQAITLAKPVRFFRASGTVSGEVLLSGRDAEGRTVPLVVRKSYGKGAFYYSFAELAAPAFAGEVRSGEKYAYTPDAALDGILKSLLRRLAHGAETWRVEAPDEVYATLYRQGDTLVAHFLNGTGKTAGPGDTLVSAAAQPAFPSLSTDVAFSLEAPEPRAVYAVSPDFDGRRPLTWTRLENGRIRIVLPRDLLQAYTLVFVGSP